LILGYAALTVDQIQQGMRKLADVIAGLKATSG
jgi:DNA-binding transcriptional MocR family regulator